jgi:WG containing repeat
MHENLVRVKRNEKFGFADATGKVVIPCQYDFAWWFENGKAKATYNARFDQAEYTTVESDEWIEIDIHGNQLK